MEVTTLSVGAIVGIVVGVIVLGIIAVYLVVKCKKSQEAAADLPSIDEI